MTVPYYFHCTVCYHSFILLSFDSEGTINDLLSGLNAVEVNESKTDSTNVM